MKTVIAFALFIAGISAAAIELKEADLGQPRIVTNAIESAIDDLRHQIRDSGLDPLDIEEREDVAVNPDLPIDVSLNGWVEGVHFSGLSDIRINNLHFGVITTRLTYDIELPQLKLILKYGKGVLRLPLRGTDHEIEGGGDGVVRRIRARGSVRVNVGIITGITIRDVVVNFSIEKILANVHSFSHQGVDKTSELSDVLNIKIPYLLDEYESEINTLLEIIVYAIAEELL